MRQAGAAEARRTIDTKGPAVTGTIDPTLLDDLVWRGLIAHSTDLGGEPRHCRA